MNKITKYILFLTITSYSIFPLICIASEAIDFADVATVNKLILNKSWSCYMKDAYGEGEGYWVFNSVNGNKVKGSLDIPRLTVCNSDVLKGKLKKNILKYRAPNNTPCREINGVMEFNYDESGIVKATGSYKLGGTHKGGKYECKLKE